MAKNKKNQDVLLYIKAKCIGCHKTSELTPKQIKDAKESGAAISECCFMPMVVMEAKYQKQNKDDYHV